MRRFIVRILWLAAIGALLYGGFVAYERWWDGDFGALKDRTFSFTRKAAENLGEKAAKTGGKALEKAKETATEVAQSAAASVVGGAIEAAGETIARWGQAVAGPSATTGENLLSQAVPAATGTAFSVPPPPVALTAKVGALLTFAVNEGTTYAAEWGDGVKDEGEKAKGETALLRHAWTVAGDYTMTLTTKDDGVTHRETFPVRIYESR